MNPGRHACNLFKRRELLIPTVWGWAVLLLLGAALIVLGVREAHPFLTVNDPVPSKILVIEGWLPDYGLQRTLAEFNRGQYDRILVTGGPVSVGTILCGYTNWAEIGAASLVRLGAGTNSVEAVPAPSVVRDRTYASAAALKAWFHRHQISATSFNLMTMADHSRRSRLLFTEALGPEYHVGVISIENQDYVPGQWWKSSEGVRTVVGELLAYGYARFLFWPPAPGRG
jgi:hypothetical protein